MTYTTYTFIYRYRHPDFTVYFDINDVELLTSKCQINICLVAAAVKQSNRLLKS